MTSAAILIGLNAYPKLLPTANLAQLSGAVHDCQDVAQMLLKHQLIDPNHLYAFVYDTDPPGAQVPGAKPFINRGSIPENGIVPASIVAYSLENFIKGLGDQGVDRLFVYISGHGGALTMAVPPLSVLLASDYQGLDTSSNEGMLVTDYIQNFVHRASRIREAIIITDSCRTSLPKTTVIPYAGSAPLFKSATRCLMIKSTVHSTPSTEADVLDNGRVVGTFTHLFLEELDAALTNNKDGKVLWRDICDAVYKRQTDHDEGQLLDYQQVTAYPLMEVRPARPVAALQTNVKLRSPVFWPELDVNVNSGTSSLNDQLNGLTVNNKQPIDISYRDIILAARISDGAAPRDFAVKQVRDFARRRIEELHSEVRYQLEELRGESPNMALPEDVYKYRSLINGVMALNTAFNYLPPEEQEHLQQVIRILTTEGDPRALERLNGQFSRSEWAAVTTFLNRQEGPADPLSTVDALAQADGFTLKVTGVTPTSSDQWRVKLQVDSADAGVQPSTVRVYQHPSLLPVIQDVAFTDGAATVVLFTRFAFTVAAKVDGGPLLKLDLRTVKGLPRRPKTE